MAYIRLTEAVKLSIGNYKLGNDTAIFNITSATDCISRSLGLCQLTDASKCYALKAERMYPQVLPYRRLQAAYWNNTRTDVLIGHFVTALQSRPKIRYLRLNESGDFRKQADVTKANDLARALKALLGITVYCYTARRDLDFRHVDFVVNGSGFMVHNAFIAIDQVPEKGIECPGKCIACKLCKVKNKVKIYVKYH